MSLTASEERTDRSNAWHNERNRQSRDIASGYPKPGDLERRKACERNLKLFLETYFPRAFCLAWSNDHLEAIARLQTAILEGGLFAFAMPRGSGKTSLAIRACLWAQLYGHRRFTALVGATEPLSESLLKQIKLELTFNEILAEDHRQVCYPFKRLENNARKAIGQLFRGAQTRIEWSSNRLVFPTMPDDACDGVNVSGSTITTSGLTGALRGQSHIRVDGTILRPELVILDDPQTRESAMSDAQSQMRAAIITGDVLGMAGPDAKISAIMPCTVIRPGDMAERMLDRKKTPEWNGQRTKMVYSFPKNEALWNKYSEIRDESFRNDNGGKEATEFYQANRQAMDEGSSVAWAERFNHDEISAIQHAMNLRFRDERAFFAEYQNEPLPILPIDESTLTADDIAAKINRFRRGLVPIQATRLTAFVDVQATLLYYAVVAWEDQFSGYVVDYGTYPEQKRAYFTLRDAKPTLKTTTKASGLEGQIFTGLESLVNTLGGREWPRDDKGVMRLDRILIDANWGPSTDVVYQFCRQSAYAAILTPSHGMGIGAGAKPMAQYNNKPGDRTGLNWRMPLPEGRRAVRHAVYDTNFWKSFVHSRLSVAMGDCGCLSIFGEKPEQHRLFADHLTAEYKVKTEGRGRTVDEWKVRPERPDNHWLDCLVGCAVAASIQGVALAESRAMGPKPRRKVSYAAMQRAKQAQRARL